MISKLLGFILKPQLQQIEERLVSRQRQDIRLMTDRICRSMVKELFTSQQATARTYWLDEAPTVVGLLKEGVKDRVLADLVGSERERVLSYIQGEEFIDQVVERIKRKQLGV